jgi:glycosyltransferase involved in cell wall biosynthesis
MLDYLKLPSRFLGKYKVIHNGLNQPPNSCETIAAFKTREHPIVLAAGRLHPRKGYETLIDAFERVSKRIPLAECWIVGGDFGDGSYGRSLQAQAQARGLCQSIKFCGYSSNVRNDMEKASLLVVPSRIEAFGMVAIEAMSLGLPVVACRTGGLQEIVAHRETGLLVPPGDSAQMANAMIQILSNPSLAKRMGQAGKSRVQELFTTNKMTASFADFYDTLLKRVA